MCGNKQKTSSQQLSCAPKTDDDISKIGPFLTFLVIFFDVKIINFSKYVSFLVNGKFG